MVAREPRARGLALGYMLSPAARARLLVARGPRALEPRARGLALVYRLLPAARARGYPACSNQPPEKPARRSPVIM